MELLELPPHEIPCRLARTAPHIAEELTDNPGSGPALLIDIDVVARRRLVHFEIRAGPLKSRLGQDVVRQVSVERIVPGKVAKVVKFIHG